MSGNQDFVIENGVLKKYNGPGGEVVIPEGVKVIEWRAFAGCTHLKQVAFPNRLTEIRYHAFLNCTGLTKVEFPKGLTRIWGHAFEGCTGLRQVVIPKRVTDIGDGIFSKCSCLTELQVDPKNRVVYTEGGALYRRDDNGTALVYWPSVHGAAAVPDGVVYIGDGAFAGCSGLTGVVIPESVKRIGKEIFQDCKALEELTFPQGVKRVGLDAFKGCTSLKRVTLSPDTEAVSADYSVKQAEYPRFTVEPKFLRITKKLSTEMAGLVWASDGEDLAYVILYQGAKAWQEAVRERVTKFPSLAVEAAQAMTKLLSEAKQPKKGAWEQAAAFVLERQEQIGSEALQAFYDLAREKKAPALPDLESDPGMRKRVTLSSEEAQTAAQPPENPVERMVFEQWKVTPTVKKLQKLVKQGIPYAGSQELCSKEALIWLVAFMADVRAEIHYMSDYKTVLEAIQQNLDPIAAGLDRAALMEFLDTMVFSGTDIQLFIPAYCRYADEEQMGKLVKQMKEWHQWSVYGAAGRSYERCAENNLWYSETKTAMRKCNLRFYAEMRGIDEQTLRDTVLADLGLDQAGKKYYDLGSKTVEARMEEDLTLTLYDPEAGKVVKSMPKQGADPEKYEAAKKDFARLKKDIRAAVKERVNLLFQRFLDGKGQKGENWKKVYFQNPMLNQIARLLVWSQNRKTFLMTAQGTVDSSGQPYEVGDKPVKVAHPMEMKQEDLARWQKYFTSHSLKQPFEQVWEPVVDFSQVKEDRYEGLTLPANQLRSQDKHGIYFDYNNAASELETGFDDLDLECDFTQFQRHWMDPDARVVFGKLMVRKESRAANHVLVKLDRWLAAERVRKDDATVVNVLDSFTLAQVTELMNLAIENQCVNCTAALLEYKNRKFPDFDPMDVFTLE